MHVFERGLFFLTNGIAKCWHLMSACCIRSVHVCESCGYRLSLFVLVLTSQKLKYVLTPMQNPNNTFFSLDLSHWINDKTDKRCETCASVSESWRQQLRPNTLHQSGDTNSSSPLCQELTVLPTVRSWKAVSSLWIGAELLLWWRGKTLSSGARLWSFVLVGPPNLQEISQIGK